jgi:hypothetical protein
MYNPSHARVVVSALAVAALFFAADGASAQAGVTTEPLYTTVQELENEPGQARYTPPIHFAPTSVASGYGLTALASS